MLVAIVVITERSVVSLLVNEKSRQIEDHSWKKLAFSVAGSHFYSFALSRPFKRLLLQIFISLENSISKPYLFFSLSKMGTIVNYRKLALLEVGEFLPEGENRRDLPRAKLKFCLVFSCHHIVLLLAKTLF